MKAEQVKEGNEVITRFMDISEATQYINSYGQQLPIYYTQTNNFRTRTYDISGKSLLEFVSESKYHTSWDWLMPVWYKFRGLKVSNVSDWNEFIWTKYQIEEAIVNLCKESPEPAFNELVKAINWYNSIKKA